jgi:hypothetical protein
MGTVRTIIRTNRRESPTESSESVCKILHPHRREVAHVVDHGVLMCGHSTILLSSVLRTPTEQEGSSTPRRMGLVEGDNLTDAHEVCSAEYNASALVVSRPLQSGRSALVPRMLSLSIGQTVSFDSNVTVYTRTDWSPRTYRNTRKGP